jgi:hypothetical protein
MITVAQTPHGHDARGAWREGDRLAPSRHPRQSGKPSFLRFPTMRSRAVGEKTIACR